MSKKFTLAVASALAFAGFMVPGQQVEASQCVTGVESWDRLNVRSGPSTRYPVVFSLRHNQCGVSNPIRCKRNWCKIRFRGRTGWANARFFYRDGGDGDGAIPPRRARRFNAPRYQGLRVDGRLSAYAGYNMPKGAHAFCQINGYSRMRSYRVATAYETIAINDGHVFYNGPRSNTSYRYIICQ